MSLLDIIASGRRRSGGVAFDVDANAYFTRASITNAGEKTNINNLVLFLKSEGIWTSLTDCWLFRVNQQKSTGTTAFALKNNSNNATMFSSPALTANGAEFRSVNHQITTPIVQTMDHDWTAAVVFRAISLLNFPRVLGSTANTAGQPGLIYFVGSAGVTTPTVGSYSVAGNPNKTIGNIAVHNFLAAAYHHTGPNEWKITQNSTAYPLVAVTHGAASHTISLSINATNEQFNNGDIAVVFLWATNCLTPTNITNLYAALKTSISQGLSLP